MENNIHHDKSRSPTLMLSVRSAEEFRLISGRGLRWIDMKDTSRGALGRPDNATLAKIASLLQRECSSELPIPTPNLSVALGELSDLNSKDIEDPQFSCLTQPFRIFKVGLSNTSDDFEWKNRWRQLRRTLRQTSTKQLNSQNECQPSVNFSPIGQTTRQQSSSIELVPVYYADHQHASSPCFDSILDLAVEEQAEFLLIDTFDKSAGRLRDHQPDSQLAEWVENAKEAKISVVLAGSLQLADVGWARQQRCDVVGFRSAACINGQRTDTLESSRIESLCEAFELESENRFLNNDESTAVELE